MPSICLISPLHISYNPRLVREADALHEAGFDVRVVSMSENPDRCALDAELLKCRGWEFVGVCARRDRLAGRLRWFRAAVRQALWSRVRLLEKTRDGAARSYSRYFPELAAAAVSRPADMFKAHLLPALPAAYMAAGRWKAKLGFDAEDLHRGEFHSSPASTALVRRAEAMENAFIPLCNHLTAASAGIADAYASMLDLRPPDVILNAFNLSERHGTATSEQLAQDRGPFAVSLYWFSATVGPDRGLADALDGLTRLPAGVGLNVRGTFAPSYRGVFLSEIQRRGLENRVRLLEPVPPGHLIQFAAQHDVGLALEPGDRLNNRLATSNKLLAYLVAGIPVAASDVPGQAVIVHELGQAGFLYPPGDAARLADGLAKWVGNREKLAEAKSAAATIAAGRYCWEIEKHKLVASVIRSLRC